LVGVGGPTAGGDDAMKMLYDLDELKHRYHIIKKMTPEAAKKHRAMTRKRNADKLFIPVSQKIIYRTIGRGPRRKVVAMRKEMHWRGRAGKPGKNYHSFKNKDVKRWFGSNPIVPANEWGPRKRK